VYILDVRNFTKLYKFVLCDIVRLNIQVYIYTHVNVNFDFHVNFNIDDTPRQRMIPHDIIPIFEHNTSASSIL
jgi:hypothetical protein